MNSMPDRHFTANQHRFTTEAGLSTGPVPLEPYRSIDFFKLEKTKIFDRAWLVICREEEIATPGDFVVKDIEICEASILLTRTKTNKIRAFYNVCSHRGSQVVKPSSGNASRFVCPYHKWVYGSEGNLLGIPDESSFFGVDKKRCGLTPVALDVWEGYVFINLTPEPEVSLQEYLGPLATYLSDVSYQFASTPLIIRAQVNANWKIVSDAFLESYHIPAVHPQTIGSTFSSGVNPFARLLDAKMLGSHAFVSMYGNPEFKLEEKHKIDLIAQRSAGTGNVISANKSEHVEKFLTHAGINPTRSKSWSMDSVQVFPNTHINMGPGGFWMHQFWPLTARSTRHEVRFYMAEPSSVQERLQQELYVGRVMEIIQEDISNMENTQKGVSSGGKRFMQLQDNEVAIRHCVETIEKWTRSASVQEALS